MAGRERRAAWRGQRSLFQKILSDVPFLPNGGAALLQQMQNLFNIFNLNKQLT